MKKIKCKVCGKVIEGYSLEHCRYMMRQHHLSKHHYDSNGKLKEKEDKKNEGSNSE